MKIGDKIYLRPMGNAARRDTDRIEETTIKSIGRKYFTAEDRYGRFHLDSFIQDCGQYSANYKAYLNKQDLLDENEKRKLTDTISGYFRFAPKLSLDQLRKINEIINQ